MVNPSTGVFYYIQGRLFIQSQDLEYDAETGRYVKPETGLYHRSQWQDIANEFLELKPAWDILKKNYLALPRGRVEYQPSLNKFVVYLAPEIPKEEYGKIKD